MRYAQIRQMDIANGRGIRVSLFVQGCTFNCPGCFNSVARDFDSGNEFTESVKQQFFDLATRASVSGISILGGEPLHPKNRPEVLKLVKEFKERFPEKDVWVWTGYLFEDVKDDVIKSDIDVLVDGPFIEEKKDITLKYCGSSNQRVIDINVTKVKGDLVLYDDD